MHRCLYIPEILTSIFGHFQDPPHNVSQAGKKALASLARACHPFSDAALDILWKDLDCLDPLLNVFPMASSAVDEIQWITFRKYAERVKTIHVKFIHRRDLRAPVPIRQEFIFMSSLQYCPKLYLPLLPNVTELEWHDGLLSALDYSGIWLLKYFGGPAVTTVTLSFLHFLLTSTELAVVAELPKLCPNVTAFTMTLGGPWTDRTSHEMGEVVAQWPKLRILHTSVISQLVMDQILARETLNTLCIDFRNVSPTCSGRIPDRIHDFSVGAEDPLACARFLDGVYASPIKFRLTIDLDEPPGERDIEDMFHLLPRRINPSRLLSLMIKPVTREIGYTLRLEDRLVPSLTQFSALRELDLDHVCTARMSDADHLCLAGPLTHLRSLKLGTAIPSHARLWPVASVGAVVAVLSCCKHLEVLHIVFDGSILPRGLSSQEDGEGRHSGEHLHRGWGVSNRHMHKLRVGYSPIKESTVLDAIASFFRVTMPCLVQIEGENEGWKAVRNLLQVH